MFFYGPSKFAMTSFAVVNVYTCPYFFPTQQHLHALNNTTKWLHICTFNFAELTLLKVLFIATATENESKVFHKTFTQTSDK